jgi:hypothetical protein
VATLGALLLACALSMNAHWLELHATQAFCFDRPAQRARARIFRALLLAAGLALLAVVRPAVGRWAGRRTLGALPADVARLVVAPTLLAWLTCELLLPRRLPPALAHFEPDPEADPRFSWRPRPSHVTDVRVGERAVRFVIDADDERIRSADEPVDPSQPTILFTGESVASGWGLPFDETYPPLVGERLHLQAVNVAVQGYANDASFLRLVDALPRFPHVVATVTLVLPGMIERNVAPDRPHLLFQSDGTWLTEPRTDHDEQRGSRVWELLRQASGLHSAEAARRAHDVMKATARASRARGALPLVVVFGWPTCLADESGAPSIDKTLFEGLDLPHVHADIPTAMWDPVTKHPDAQGQARIADVIVRALREQGVGR